MEYRLRRHDGQYRWVQDNGVPHFSKNKEFLGFIGTCVDIHELKEIENRKDQFIVAASHELKTPLTHLIFICNYYPNISKVSQSQNIVSMFRVPLNRQKKLMISSTNFWTCHAFNRVC